SRILNAHYGMPPDNMIVELMTDGYTHPEILPFLAERHKEAGLVPFIAPRASDYHGRGRIDPEELDQMWKLFFKAKQGPCRLMDEVGLDTVQAIEQHYIKERGLSKESKEKTVDFLEDNYIKPSKLGDKGDKGGLYPPGYAHDALV
ncbi:hypothetical protein KCU86_g15847, partial [Aureobasidium melanogenum]